MACILLAVTTLSVSGLRRRASPGQREGIIPIAVDLQDTPAVIHCEKHHRLPFFAKSVSVAEQRCRIDRRGAKHLGISNCNLFAGDRSRYTLHSDGVKIRRINQREARCLSPLHDGGRQGVLAGARMARDKAQQFQLIR